MASQQVNCFTQGPFLSGWAGGQQSKDSRTCMHPPTPRSTHAPCCLRSSHQLQAASLGPVDRCHPTCVSSWPEPGTSPLALVKRQEEPPAVGLHCTARMAPADAPNTEVWEQRDRPGHADMNAHSAVSGGPSHDSQYLPLRVFTMGSELQEPRNNYGTKSQPGLPHPRVTVSARSGPGGLNVYLGGRLNINVTRASWAKGMSEHTKRYTPHPATQGSVGQNASRSLSPLPSSTCHPSPPPTAPPPDSLA